MRNRLYDRLVQSSGPNYYRLNGYIFVYIILDFLSIRSTSLWALILAESFYIAGECQSTGQCCSGIMLYHQGRSLDTVARFQDACQQNESFSMFKFTTSTGGDVVSYDCQQLSQSKRCLDYSNRPHLCRVYPYNYFLKSGHLHSTCGYYIRPRLESRYFWYAPLRRSIESIFKQHGLR